MSRSIANIIAEVDERGYSIIPSVITPVKADEAQTVLEKHLASESSAASIQTKTQRVGRIAIKHPIFVELISHPPIVSIWRAYLGDEVICSTWSANTSYRGFDNFSWHPDFSYWLMKLPWPADRISGQTIWLLDDFTEGNGGTGVIPYSHGRDVRRPR